MLSMLLAAAVAAEAPAQTGSAPATLVVNLPSDAKLFVDNRATTSTGSVRELATPTLSRGGSYTYTLRAQVVRDGQVVTQERTVRVSGGLRRNVSFDFSNSGGSGTGNSVSGGSVSNNAGGGGLGGGSTSPGGGGSSVLPDTPGGGKIVMKKVIDPATGKLVTQKSIVYPNGKTKIVSGPGAGKIYPPRPQGNRPQGNRPQGNRPQGSGQGGIRPNGTGGNGGFVRPGGGSGPRPGGSGRPR